MRIARLLFVLPLLLAASVVHSANLKLVWTFDNSPTATCADGMPAATHCPPTGFQIEKKAANGTWSVTNDDVAVSLRELTLQNVLPGQHCYRMRTKAGAGISETPSPESCATVPFSSPKSPVIISVTVNVSVTLAPQTVEVPLEATP